MRFGVHQEILRLDVTIADPKCMHVCQSLESLVGVKFNQYHRYCLFVRVVMLQNSEYGFGYIVHN